MIEKLVAELPTQFLCSIIENIHGHGAVHALFFMLKQPNGNWKAMRAPISRKFEGKFGHFVF